MVNLKFPYLVNDESKNLRTVEEVNYERDLGVIFKTNLNWREQRGTFVNKAKSEC